MVTDEMVRAEQLRQEANELDRKAQESFERCDTDGFLSQWGYEMNANRRRLEADLLEQGGQDWFSALFNLENQRVRAKLIDGKFGLCWAFCDMNDHFTGKFIKAHPAKLETMHRKGFLEGREMAPAKVKIVGSDLCNCHATTIRTDKGYPSDAIEVK